MVSILNCIYFENNLALVLLAAVVCVFGSFVFLRLVCRGLDAKGTQRLGWQFLAAAAGGGGVWTTHFVAMLAYDPLVPVAFDPVPTLLSLVIAMAGLFVSLLIGGTGKSWVFAAVSGAFCGLSFAAMHYTGMFAYRVIGLVEWDFGYVVASILLAVTTSSFAVSLIDRSGKTNKVWLPVGVLVLGIVGLHFTGMTAFQVIPMSEKIAEVDQQAVMALALAIAVVSLIIIGTGLASYLIDTNVRASSKAHLRHMISHDPLTGLPNRVSFKTTLAEAIKLAELSNRKLAVIGIDLNRFKEINDTLGHAAGDEVLQTLARRLEQALGSGDYIARLGGDEFAAIMQVDRKDEVVRFAEHLNSVFSIPMNISGVETNIGASMGAAIFPDDATNQEDLVNNADLAMYHAKHALKASFCFYDIGIGARVRERRMLAEHLAEALEREKLELHYQVQKVLGGDEQICGYEALLRWRHPTEGLIPTSDFIPVAEENSLIAALGAWVLRQACRDAAEWAPPYRVAVNVSAVQFMDSNLPRIVEDVLLETGLPANRLELELTETALIRDKCRSLKIMQDIKALGVTIALDDFGTGYSSLETLRAFPFDKIKLDKAFIDNVCVDRQSRAIVRAFLALGKSLEIPVLAEGIETEEQKEILREEGCDAGQGYLLGRPMPKGDLPVHGGPVGKIANFANYETHGTSHQPVQAEPKSLPNAQDHPYNDKAQPEAIRRPRRQEVEPELKVARSMYFTAVN